MTLAVLQRHLIKSRAILTGAVEIRVGGYTQLFGRRKERPCQRIHAAEISDMQRPARAVVFRCAPLLSLGLLEVGKNILESPAAVAETRPIVVVARIAPDVNHGVHGTR